MFASALQTLLTPEVLIALFIGVVGGMIIGAMPGLSASMAVALLIPVTYSMGAAAGLVMLTAVYTSAIYGGSITACLLHTPGTPSSAATAMDGYALTKQGKGLKAIGVATLCSMIGGTISAFCLLFIAPPLSKVVLSFSSLEYFLLAVFGLTIIGSVASDNMVKGLLSGCLGILVGIIGIDIFSGTPRFTFGSINLESGIQLVPAMIGLFSLSQVMISIEDIVKGNNRILDKNATHLSGEMLPNRRELKSLMPTILQSSIIGVLVGILPGAGGDIGSWISYNTAKKTSKHPEKFGHGSIEGVAASEAANNAVTGGALIPMLTLGIPGSGVTAIMLGGLMIKGLNPGYKLFAESGSITYCIIFGFLLANILMGLIGILIAKQVVKISVVPMTILCPVILALSLIGAYAIRLNIFDVYVMLAFGLLGYFMRKFDFATAPVVLGMILGPMAEKNWRQAIVLFRGDALGYFFSRPISIVLAILTIGALFFPIIVRIIKKKASPSADTLENTARED
uniref:tripartite tricarboxylate transporter permease n=1 Tax=Ndongobacter massiliensis TaxID=1871025 RepID=UPI0009319245|nr:tripartite tricarboxylate transporter permease [Ndongobacter massiliensis]